MAEKVVFPLLSGLNWPSNVLQVWLALHDIGVSEYKMRLLPEFGYLTLPEVVEEHVDEDPYQDDPAISSRHPHGPQYDSHTQTMTVHLVDPEEIRPRLKVHVTAETLMHFDVDQIGEQAGDRIGDLIGDNSNALAYREEIVGRLAHFMPPMTAGLPQAGTAEQPIESARPKERPVETMVRQVCRRYPELMTTIPASARDTLSALADSMEKAFWAADPQAQLPFIDEISEGLSRHRDLPGCRNAFESVLDKLESAPPEEVQGMVWRGMIARFRLWSDVLFEIDPRVRVQQIAAHLAGMESEQRREQARIVRQLGDMLAFEYPAEREKVVRELMEIMTTIAFSATAASDLLWGLGYLHGRLSDYCEEPAPLKHDAHLLSVVGGLQRGQLLVTLMSTWAEQGFLGVLAGRPEPSEPGERQRGQREKRLIGEERELMPDLTEAECRELWSLVSLRRQAADPLVLFEMAAKRLIHPEIQIEMHRFLQAPGRLGTLFAQLQQSGETGGTAVLGGKAMLHYPGVTIRIPLSEDADDGARRAKRVIDILTRLFLPVCLHQQTVWQESVARMGQGAYLQHDFQQGVRLTSGGQAQNANERSVDPVVL